MNILISAYGCEPNKGSEAGVGWNWVKIAAQHNNLWVITRSNNQAVIEESPEDWVTSVRWVYFDLPGWIKKIKKGEKRLYFYYFLWQIGALNVAKKILESNPIDCTWHLSFGSMWMPTFLYRLSIPFIWGPVGGGESIPPAYWKNLSLKNRLVEWLRSKIIQTASLNPLFYIPAMKASAIIVRTEDSKKIFPQSVQKKIFLSLETCMDQGTLDFYRAKSLEQKEIVNFVYTGRLIPLKGIEIPIRAMKKAKYRDRMHLMIVGKGQQKQYLQDLVKRIGLEKQIEFMDYMPRNEALAFVRNQDVFVFPSLKEGGTWALLEAMAIGLPAICHDTSGMHVIADEKCSVLIRPEGMESSILQFADAMDSFVVDQKLIVTKGRAAHERVEKLFVWDTKERLIKEILEEIKKAD